MKLLAMTDTHGNRHVHLKAREKARNADLVVHTGDMTVFERDLKKAVADLAAIGKPVLVIHGNHEYSGALEKECAKYSSLIFAHDRVVRIGGLTFLGWGGGGFAQADPEFETRSDHLARLTKGERFIFLIHGPPEGTTLDRMQHLGHRGCHTRRKFIVQHQPALVLCGHLHENFGKQDRIKNSLIINPGADGMILDVSRIIQAPLLTSH